MGHQGASPSSPDQVGKHPTFRIIRNAYQITVFGSTGPTILKITMWSMAMRNIMKSMSSVISIIKKGHTTWVRRRKHLGKTLMPASNEKTMFL